MNIMNTTPVYGSPLMTDLYQLTMGAAFWKSGMQDQEAVFHLFFRKNPYQGGYAVAAGLEAAVDWLQHLQFGQNELAYLGSLEGSGGGRLFEQGFLDYLKNLRWSCDLDAVPEGTVVFPNQPLLRVKGPIIQAQLAETALLNFINYQTLVATKAARICDAAGGDPVIEFGLRRAQGPDGGLSASRAAYVGGCSSTSNVLAGKRYGIPVKGTHAHSWVMAFDTEIEAFEAYAEAMPENSILLVDTYDTLNGVRQAVKIGHQLREKGHTLAGIRLDSGDLAWLSIEARRILDGGGFPDARIVGSNDLDEYLVESLKSQGARIDIWGIGTRLVTGGDQAALGGVYKLSGVREPGGAWQARMKFSEETEKASIPGVQQVRRFIQDEVFVGDAVYDEAQGCPDPVSIVDAADPIRRKSIPAGTSFVDLLEPVFRGGALVYTPPTLQSIQARTGEQRGRLDPSIRRLRNPHRYPAGLERELALKRQRLLEAPCGDP